MPLHCHRSLGCGGRDEGNPCRRIHRSPHQSSVCRYVRLGVEVERLLLSVAESVYHLPVVGEPGAERLEVDATVQLYNVPYLVVLHGEIFRNLLKEWYRRVPASEYLK